MSKAAREPGKAHDGGDSLLERLKAAKDENQRLKSRLADLYLRNLGLRAAIRTPGCKLVSAPPDVASTMARRSPPVPRQNGTRCALSD